MSQESEKKKDPNPNNIGGQAVIEGVMMRGKEIYAMAVRQKLPGRIGLRKNSARLKNFCRINWATKSTIF